MEEQVFLSFSVAKQRLCKAYSFIGTFPTMWRKPDWEKQRPETEGKNKHLAIFLPFLPVKGCGFLLETKGSIYYNAKIQM